jgi:glycerol-3-phosphate acyltransferase PlsX
VACQLVADGEADAVVSAGSTGATLAAALLTIGRLPGIRRPVVAAVLPVEGGRAVLADAGGSMDVQPEALPGYAAMASAYATVLGIAAPRIGLLNVGAEPGKGNALTKAAFDLLRGMEGFVGNVEPLAVLGGAADVVVTDGFTGNVFLKTVEASARDITAETDATAILLGVAGEVLVAHGDASAHDVAQALARAAEVAQAGLAAQVGQRMAPEEETTA